MRISRGAALACHYLFDECVPPAIRDSRWFTWLPMKLLFGRHAETFRTFKDRAHGMSADEFRRVYEELAAVHVQRPTDLTAGCIDAIMRNVVGPTVLDVGCGRGHLAALLATTHRVTGSDIVIPPGAATRHPQVAFVEESVEQLSWSDRAFDTVVCTHTLEHVRDVERAVQELRRVAARRLIVVVPRQRPYRHTFDLHLNFFPLAAMLLARFPLEPGVAGRSLHSIDGEWYYQEDRLQTSPPEIAA
jgi:SAM-dependent methyltransferase